MSSHIALRRLSIASCAAIVASALLGCSGSSTSTLSSTPAVQSTIAGNWFFASSAPSAVKLPQLAGALIGTNSAFTGTLHAATSSACVSPQTYIPVTGSVDASGNLTMTSSSFASGSVIALTASFSSGKMSNVTYNIAGGTCSFLSAQANAMSATLQQPISGTYNGSFIDNGGNVIPITSMLQQSAQPDANGIFHVSGMASYPASAGVAPTSTCITSPVVTDSTITGNTLSTTYSQTLNGVTNTVVATGTFDSMATTLTISNWTLSAPCGPDDGTGTLVKQ